MAEHPTTSTAPMAPNLNPGLQQSIQRAFEDSQDLTQPTAANPYEDHTAILALVKKLKDQAFGSHRIGLERHWQRMMHYIMDNQWIWWHPNRREWMQTRTHDWVPKVVTNVLKPGLQTIRTTFGAVDIGVIARPIGQDPKNVATASIADEIEPVIRDEHGMMRVQHAADFWQILLGNVFLHPWWNMSRENNGIVTVNFFQCQDCGTIARQDQIEETSACPSCQSPNLGPLLDQQMEPVTEQLVVGSGQTDIVSSLELGVPPNYLYFPDMPYVLRSRWRDKGYYENNYEHLVKKLNFKKSPSERNLQILNAIQSQQYLGPGSFSSGGDAKAEGITEFELWMKPSRAYPEGLVVRMANDILITDENQGLPGPLPEQDSQGGRLFPWVHTGYEQIGGRFWHAGAFDSILHKQDQLNQLDSLVLLIVNRMANPVWLEPKGAEVERFTGAPGLVVKWNPLGPQGLGKPERIEGTGPHSSIFTLREQILKDIEEAVGTFDILKGGRPPGVEAFAALQLLKEQSSSRLGSALKARGESHRQWYQLVLEQERLHGPDQRIKQLLGPNRKWAFKTYQNAQLQGAVEILVEDGTLTPKTALGKRAAQQQAVDMGLVNVLDPDVAFGMLSDMGLKHLIPGLDVHKQEALREQEAFETWIQMLFSGEDTGEDSPLRRWTWHSDEIHEREHIKWANSGNVRELLEMARQKGGPQAFEAIAGDIALHIEEHRFGILETLALQADAQAPAPKGGGKPSSQGQGAKGAAQSLSNSNREAGSTRTVPSGTQESAQGGEQGPA